MADLLQRASAWLESQPHQHLTQLVTYRRGSQTAELQATIGSTEFEVDDGAGALIRSESRDFLVLAADLVLGGQRTLPQRGDRITEGIGQIVVVYEVMAPGQEPIWRYSDPYRQTLRIHTKQVATESAE